MVQGSTISLCDPDRNINVDIVAEPFVRARVPARVTLGPL